MAGLVVEVKAPIFVFREWHRHRTQSYNEMSARYVPLPDQNYMPTIERLMDGANTETANKQAQGNGRQLTNQDAQNWWSRLDKAYTYCEDVYQEGLRLGIPKELARLPLPVARYSRMRASANLRNWLGFLALRQAPDAQWEIREYANAVGQIIAESFPRTWSLFSE
jgi:thymidylate synthase (FAD)